jgi:CRP-like cAMP-binding protein
MQDNHKKQLADKLHSLYPLSPAALDAILSITSELSVPRGSVVQAIGKSCKNLYFINKGSLRIFYYKDGIDITESFEFENSFVARGESLLTMKPSTKGIETIEDTELMVLYTPALFALFDKWVEVERMFSKIIEQAYIQLINRMESIQFHTANERYKMLLTENPKAIQRIPLKYIASYLGITQVSLSRIRAGQR